MSVKVFRRRWRGLRLGLALTGGCAALASCAAPALVQIGTVELVADDDHEGRRFGGVSGLDRDPRTDAWVMVSDDRSDPGAARFYEAALVWRRDRLVAADVLRTHGFRNDAGVWSAAAGGHGTAIEAVDAESIRLDPLNDDLLWSSEGDSVGGFNPSVRRARRNGRGSGGVPLPDGMEFHRDGRRGALPNRTIEGLSWTPDGQGLWSAMEGPLAQDGPLSDADRGALVRFTLQDRSGSVLTQVAYEVDPLIASLPGRLADSGVSEILTLDDDRLLVLERAGLQTENGGFRYRARLYCADLTSGDEVADVDSLKRGATRPITKRLVHDFAGGAVTHNFEGMAWGPRLSDGRLAIVFVSDNNFDGWRPTVLAAFALTDTPDAWARDHCPSRTVASQPSP
ncbi:MAG: esterase-like activity of phytase family protein [Pseudomonadota bacterium]|nr:esterase-like activity of phytase family protein [Pseudomonadota bacterium]